MRLADSFLIDPASGGARDAPVISNWKAELSLRFAQTSADPARTALVERRHFGPLRVQKALYPEGAAICHAIVLHPPAGIAGGDELAIDIRVDAGAHAVLATPGAAKWYKAHGRVASQTIKLQIETGACLEWLPMENIFFDGAQARMNLNIDCSANASAIGWDACTFGRQAAQEEWRSGALNSSITLRCDGRLRWVECFDLAADSSMRSALTGLDGLPVMATLWAFGPGVNAALAEALATQMPWDNQLRAGVTCLRDHDDASGLLLLRVLGQKMEAVQVLLRSIWMTLRPTLLEVPGRPLRIWAT